MSINMKKFLGVLVMFLFCLICANHFGQERYLPAFAFGLLGGWCMKGIVYLIPDFDLNKKD